MSSGHWRRAWRPCCERVLPSMRPTNPQAFKVLKRPGPETVRDLALVPQATRRWRKLQELEVRRRERELPQKAEKGLDNCRGDGPEALAVPSKRELRQSSAELLATCELQLLHLVSFSGRRRP